MHDEPDDPILAPTAAPKQGRGDAELLETLFDSAPVLVAYMDRDFNFVRVNRLYAEADGRTPDFFPGRNHFDLYPDVGNEGIFRRVIETGEPSYAYEKPFRYTDHPERGISYWDWILQPVREADGTVSGLVFGLADVTRRVRLEQEKRQAEERLRAMANAARDAMIMMDDHGRICFWNAAAVRIFGYSEEEALGKPLHALIAGEEGRRLFEQQLPTFRATGTGPVVDRTLEMTAFRKNGRALPVELSVSSLRLDGAWHALGIVRDITDRKEAQMQIWQAQKMESLGNLAGGIAHDVNNMLVPVLGLSEMLLDDLPDGSPSKDSMVLVVDAARRIKGLVERILTFSRMEATQHEPLNIAAVVADAVMLMRTLVPKAVEFRLSIDEAVGTVEGNTAQIYAVLMNLVSNAIDAVLTVRLTGGDISLSLERMVPDEHLAAIVPSLEAGRAYAMLRVKDNGCGIEPEDLTRVFDPFFTTKAAGKGTGLGLPMVHSIAGEHGGAVRLHSLPGWGTTVEVYLPLAAAAGLPPSPGENHGSHSGR